MPRVEVLFGVFRFGYALAYRPNNLQRAHNRRVRMRFPSVQVPLSSRSAHLLVTSKACSCRFACSSFVFGFFRQVLRRISTRRRRLPMR